MAHAKGQLERVALRVARRHRPRIEIDRVDARALVGGRPFKRGAGGWVVLERAGRAERQLGACADEGRARVETCISAIYMYLSEGAPSTWASETAPAEMAISVPSAAEVRTSCVRSEMATFARPAKLGR